MVNTITLSKENYKDLLNTQNKMARFALATILSRRLIKENDYSILRVSDDVLHNFINRTEFSENNKQYLKNNLKRFLYNVSGYAVMH